MNMIRSPKSEKCNVSLILRFHETNTDEPREQHTSSLTISRQKDISSCIVFIFFSLCIALLNPEQSIRLSKTEIHYCDIKNGVPKSLSQKVSKSLTFRSMNLSFEEQNAKNLILWSCRTISFSDRETLTADLF